MAPLLKAGADVERGDLERHDAADARRGVGRRRRGHGCSLDSGADVNAKESVRGLTPAMFAAASNRAAVIELLRERGADLKATSKVTDLAALSRDPAALRELTQGNPPPPGEPPAGGRNGPRRRHAGGRRTRAADRRASIAISS